MADTLAAMSASAARSPALGARARPATTRNRLGVGIEGTPLRARGERPQRLVRRVAAGLA